MSDKLITIIVPKEIHDKLFSIKKTRGISIQFQINEILKEKLCKSQR